MIGLARAFHREVIAEGVENAAQLNLLRDLSADDLAGWARST